MSKLIIALILVAASVSTAFADDSAQLSGKEVYESRCFICHQMPPIGMLSEEQWRTVVKNMQVRMKSRDIPQLTEAEVEALLKHLTKADK